MSPMGSSDGFESHCQRLAVSSPATHRVSATRFDARTHTVIHVGNGLIFAFVVALWAAYFVPLAVRRHDEASKSSSVEKLSSLSRVIKAKVQREDSDEDEAPVATRTGEPTAATSASATQSATASAALAPSIAPTMTRESSRIAARRRRRTLLSLLFIAVVVGGVTVFSLIPLWAPAIPVALIVAWLVACRVQVRGELGISHKRHFGHAAEEEQTVIISGQFEDIDPHRKHDMQKADLAPDALEQQLVIAVPVGTTKRDALWDPLPVTLPTYVTKPRAGRTVRTIEFGEPGAWTSGHIEGEDVELPKQHVDADEHRHAVGH